MSFDAAALQHLSPDELKKIMAMVAAQDTSAFKEFLNEDADAKRAAKQALGTGGSKRQPSWLEPIWSQILTCDAMLDALGISRGETDSETLTSVLSIIDGRVEGSQEAVTLTYETDGRSHKVRITVLSEDNAASGVLAKALEQVEAASSDNFTKVADKFRKRVKLGRIDSATKKEMLEQFESAVQRRAAEINAASAAPPPPPPV